ncbi:MAG: co-chaperone YbbN, partial [Arthrobacter sp.]|nr:co-chaperone YbbN [Arthrobacter sp.]
MSSPASRPVPPAAANLLNLRGAVDLSSLKQRPASPAGTGTPQEGAQPGAAPGAQELKVNVTEGNFQQLVELSAQVPVVFALWASYSPESAAVLEVLERVVGGYGGRLVLGSADIEAFPQLAQAFQVQAVPTAVAVLKGQPVPLFQGSADEQQVRSLFDELLKVAAANGVTGSLGAGGAEEDAPAPLPPLHQAAFDAIEAGDYAAAAEAYRQALTEMPADHEAK